VCATVGNTEGDVITKLDEPEAENGLKGRSAKGRTTAEQRMKRANE
jgi:hypothetical protein